MPISTTKRSALLFATDKAAITATKHARWSHLNTAQQDFWKDKARDFVYPDLRVGYNMHSEMLHTMAIALYETYLYYKQGGGGQHPSVQPSNIRESIFDEYAEELKNGYP